MLYGLNWIQTYRQKSINPGNATWPEDSWVWFYSNVHDHQNCLYVTVGPKQNPKVRRHTDLPGETPVTDWQGLNQSSGVMWLMNRVRTSSEDGTICRELVISPLGTNNCYFIVVLFFISLTSRLSLLTPCVIMFTKRLNMSANYMKEQRKDTEEQFQSNVWFTCHNPRGCSSSPFIDNIGSIGM
jgi:hypothetical protein